MGIDCEISFRANRSETYPVEGIDLPNDFEIVAYSEDPDGDCRECYGRPTGSTHFISTCQRYYGEGYERGPWPTIAEVLMKLLSCPAVVTVWYGGDGDDEIPPCTPDHVIALCRHFMEYGRRPYDGAGFGKNGQWLEDKRTKAEVRRDLGFQDDA